MFVVMSTAAHEQLAVKFRPRWLPMFKRPALTSVWGVAKGGIRTMSPLEPKRAPSRCQKYGEGHNKGSVSIMKYEEKTWALC